MIRRPPASAIPDGPGVYLFHGAGDRVLYIGKAKSLRKRIANYFGQDLMARTRRMVEHAERVEWIITDTEVDALMLEYTLVQKHQPRFNIKLRDDKSFPYMAITSYQEWPRVMVMRGKRRKGVQYFGPYAHAYAIRQTRDLLLRTFPIRSCTDTKFKSHQSLGRPCLLFHIERCSGPCVGEVDRADYDDMVDGFAAFLDGDRADLTARLWQEMVAAADRLEYEHAARLRDQLASVEKALQRQELVSDRPETFDLIAIEDGDLEAAVVVFNVTRGRLTGRMAMVLDKVEDVTSEELMGIVLRQTYGEGDVPKLVLVATLPPDPDVWTEWLERRRGTKVGLRVPQRGAKRRLLETAYANAREELSRHRLKRASDHNARAKALRSLQDHLGLDRAPLRIECYDISTIQGTDTVGSMVVFEDGLPKKSDYKRFRVKSLSGQDDFAAMEEVLRRRFTAYEVELKKPVEDRGKFSYPPSLIVIDGGAGQLGRAVKVLDEFGLDIPVAGLAKRLEEVYQPDREQPLMIPRGEEALYLLQSVRDEAHRFAITYHRRLRSKRMVDSVLDAVPGVGPKRKRRLLRRFGSLKRLRKATFEEIAEVVPEPVADELIAALTGTSAGSRQ
jgi:excinuclease ABC subunit C